MTDRVTPMVRKRRRDSSVLTFPVLSDDTWMPHPETGEPVPPLRVRRFLEWFMDPERAAGTTLVQWARDNDVNVNTVRGWLRDPRFTKVMEERAQELNLRPDRTQAVIEAVWRKAVNGDIKAAALYLQHVGKLQPATQKVDVTVTHKVADLTDEQLQAELAKVQARAALTARTVDAEIIEG